MIRATIAFLAFITALSPAFAQTVTLAWDAHEEAAQITGFHLWQSKQAGGPYVQVATFTPGTLVTGSIPKPGLGRYCFVLTAYADVVESDNSNEVCTTLKPKPPRLVSAIQTALMAPVKVVTYLAGLFTKKTLKIKSERG